VSTRPFRLSTRSLRWGAPIVAGIAVAAAAIIPSAAASSQHPALPARDAGQLLADLATVHAPNLSGTIVETARLGLPDLSSLPGADAALSWQSLITGSHTIHIWLSGQDRQRVALLGDLAETDVIHNGTDLWTYASQSNSVTHVKLPADAAKKDLTPASALPVSPQQAAQEALQAINPTTKVSVDLTAEVAGRPAYQIELRPRDSRSLIASVRIALDSQTKIPLRVQVFATGQSLPAFETAFTEVSYAKPAASIFAFVPPAGATVNEHNVANRTTRKVFASASAKATRPTEHVMVQPGSKSGARTHFVSGVTVIGSGWTAVAVANAQSVADLLGGAAAGGPGGGGPGGAGQISSLLMQIATPVAGGHVVRTALFTVLFANDGRVLIGPVGTAAIQQVAATGRAL